MPPSPPPIRQPEQRGANTPGDDSLEVLSDDLRDLATDAQILISSYERAARRLETATTHAASFLDDLNSSKIPLEQERKYLKSMLADLYTINVGGRIFEVSGKLLFQFPNSLLTSLLIALPHEPRQGNAFRFTTATAPIPILPHHQPLHTKTISSAATSTPPSNDITQPTAFDSTHQCLPMGVKRAREGDEDAEDGGVITLSDESPLSFRSCSSGYHSDLMDVIDKNIVCDAVGNLFFDRDPEIFELLLSVMRSSRSHVMLSPEKAEMVLHDAVFYQLDNLQIQKACVATADGTLELFFDYHAKKSAKANMDQLSHLGPNINAQRTRFRSVYSVCVVGKSFISGGEHTCTFRVNASEYVGVGMISEHCDTMDAEFHKVRNCCVFYMSGVLYSNFPHHEKRETNMKFGDGALITISLNMDQRTIIFKINDGDPVILSCATAQRLRFVAVMKNQSSVQIEGGTTDSTGFDFSERCYLPYEPLWNKVVDADGTVRFIKVRKDDDDGDEACGVNGSEERHDPSTL